ncbi:MAG: hypothetical protein WCW16_02960 [Candidatus Magasanikbacteria bacterium]
MKAAKLAALVVLGIFIAAGGSPRCNPVPIEVTPECYSDADCGGVDNECEINTCDAGRCVRNYMEEGAVCDDGNSNTTEDQCYGDKWAGLCLGHASFCEGTGEISPDSVPCTDYLYNNQTSECYYKGMADGTQCPNGMCIASTCVVNGCLMDADCPGDMGCNLTTNICESRESICFRYWDGTNVPDGSPCFDTDDEGFIYGHCQSGECIIAQFGYGCEVQAGDTVYTIWDRAHLKSSGASVFADEIYRDLYWGSTSDEVCFLVMEGEVLEGEFQGEYALYVEPFEPPQYANTQVDCFCVNPMNGSRLPVEYMGYVNPVDYGIDWLGVPIAPVACCTRP